MSLARSAVFDGLKSSSFPSCPPSFSPPPLFSLLPSPPTHSTSSTKTQLTCPPPSRASHPRQSRLLHRVLFTLPPHTLARSPVFDDQTSIYSHVFPGPYHLHHGARQALQLARPRVRCHGRPVHRWHCHHRSPRPVHLPLHRPQARRQRGQAPGLAGLNSETIDNCRGSARVEAISGHAPDVAGGGPHPNGRAGRLMAEAGNTSQ
ncbi:hypothetical protein B0T11DRAFT_270203 [Plectosphaerella cucumerina]|uniref:Uncharacterized protein n=1 Tax=Plectosphaerella cucumerina TaxID=40658 RepID=A0A8K0TT26_9PEZI|nr:hypothetical protein B0T11DRAFT_270203 [Plectosphaerella cucumerina]